MYLHQNPIITIIRRRVMNNGKVLLNDLDLAYMLSVSRATIWRLKGQGKLPPPVRLGRAVRWKRSDIVMWFDNKYSLQKMPDMPDRQ
jgi:predicted DNA-binding transcriptional regulator AlpA